MLLKVLDESQALSAAMLADGITTLNELLDSWSQDGLHVPTARREVFNLTGGQASYTMGIGGDFETARPVEIVEAAVLIEGSEYPLEILRNVEKWSEVSTKSFAGQPCKLFAEGAYPLETLKLYPVPSQAYQLVLYSNVPHQQYASGLADLVVPGGYSRALRYNLAIDLGTEYIEASPDVKAIAQDSKTIIERRAIKPVYSSSDSAIASRYRFDGYTGD